MFKVTPKKSPSARKRKNANNRAKDKQKSGQKKSVNCSQDAQRQSEPSGNDNTEIGVEMTTQK